MNSVKIRAKVLLLLLAFSLSMGACNESANLNNESSETGTQPPVTIDDSITGTEEEDTTFESFDTGDDSSRETTSDTMTGTDTETDTDTNTDTGTEVNTETESESNSTTTDLEENPPVEPDNIVFAESGKAAVFKFIYGSKNSADRTMDFSIDLIDAICKKTGVQLDMSADNSKGTEADYEILVNSTKRKEAKAVLDALNDGEFAIEYIKTADKTYIVIAYKGDKARLAVRNTFINQFVNCSDSNTCMMPTTTQIKKTAKWEDIVGTDNVQYPITDPEIVSEYIIKTDFTYDTSFPNVRDAFVMYENGLYYLYYSTYTTGYAPASWVVRTSSSLDGKWSTPKTLLKVSDLTTKYGLETYKNAYNWAPEIHKYNGKYYIFTTYWCGIAEHDSPNDQVHDGKHLTGHFASIILRSNSPMGPFDPISRDDDGNLGHSTPAKWDTIDMTFYVDDDGQPWGIFSRDRICTTDFIGSFYAAKLSDDLTSFVSEPIELFKAGYTTPFSDRGITDGCYLYRAQNGELLLLWSPLINDDKGKYWYSVAVARSTSGSVEGPWVQQEELLYSKAMYNNLDGGHPSLFTDENGQMWMCIHTPNYNPVSPTFIPVVEVDNNLVWGISVRPN